MNTEIKKALFELLENVVKDVIESAFKIAKTAIEDSENTVDDLLLPYLDKIKECVLTYADKIYTAETDAE